MRESDYELAFLHLFWYGLLLGIHLLVGSTAHDERAFTRAGATLLS